MLPAPEGLVRASLNRAKARGINYISLLSHLVAKSAGQTIALFKLLPAPPILPIKASDARGIAPLADLANSHTSNHVATTAHEVGGNASGDQDRFLSAWHKRLVHACKHINSNRGRLVASIGLLLVPIAVLGFLFVAQSYKSIGFAERELKGVAYAPSLPSSPILQDVIPNRAHTCRTSMKHEPGSTTISRRVPHRLPS